MCSLTSDLNRSHGRSATASWPAPSSTETKGSAASLVHLRLADHLDVLRLAGLPKYTERDVGVPPSTPHARCLGRSGRRSATPSIPTSAHRTRWSRVRPCPKTPSCFIINSSSGARFAVRLSHRPENVGHPGGAVAIAFPSPVSFLHQVHAQGKHHAEAQRD